METPMAAPPVTVDAMDLTGPDDPTPVAGPAREFTAMKVALYELLIRQLQDDGFQSEARGLSQQLHIEPNGKVDKDALVNVYEKSLKWSFGDEPPDAWVPVHCTPVPPLGLDEKFLDLDDLGSGGDVDMADGAAKKSTPNADALKKAPEIRQLYTLQHRAPCHAVGFSNDGRFSAAGYTDGSVRILDCARMRSVGTAGDGVAGKVRLTEEELLKPVTRVLQDHILGITCLAFHPMNPTLFSGSLDKTVKIFDLTRPPGHKKAFSVLQDVHPVRCICVHPCGDFLFAGTSHQVLRLYDLQTLNCFTTFHQDDHHSTGINDIRCTSDGHMFASASGDGCIQIWDATSQRKVNRIQKAHSGSAVTSVRWSRNLNYLLSAGTDGRCRLWDMRFAGKEIYTMGFGPRSCDFSTAIFAAGERYVANANSNIAAGDVSMFDAQKGSPVFMKLGMHSAPVHAIDASPVDRTVLTGCDDEKVRFFEVQC
eukprot:gnl/TRDRNA2_/TRDRNA2_56292_c0_seq1.p1 gnl/TRDRNA2_/TRDRNA2_56292_c0~~gnl/TRDRNA2_/TRDRNA2_56292_c0_seq1.p1  ORF type:complete len:500 (+),score=99.67 gnl/TRDRNA2_/TRDRNA2_56292_c0_seq1:63-1502(+)